MSAPRPYETDPFHPLDSNLNITIFYIYVKKYQLFLPCGTCNCVGICQLRMCICRTLKLMFGAIFKVILFSMSWTKKRNGN